MKTANYFKQFLPAVAALTLVGTVSSCADKDFDWDDAHANTTQKKFTETFIKEFGKPAEGHQWGFDLAEMAMGGTDYYGMNQASSTRAQYKPNEPINNIPASVVFGTPADISKKEHQEVYAWFSHHKVEWTNTPIQIALDDLQANSGYNTRENSGTVPLTPAASSGMTESELSDYYRNTLGFGSLVDHSSNVLGDYTYDNPTLSFRNGWVQDVASNQNSETVVHTCVKQHDRYIKDNVYYCKQSDGYHELDNVGTNHLANGKILPLNEPGMVLCTSEINKASHMDHLCAGGMTENTTSLSFDHIQDWNGGSGYGYSKNQFPGTLYTNVDFNTFVYGCSSGSSAKHDKYLLVYLEGDGYEGWYLGFDFESFGSSQELIKADGICNDWIIKIGDAGQTSYQNARIMCEDLGGVTSTSDIDYNDLVLDVDYVNKNNNASVVTLRLQAAGGTMPLAVFYGETKLFEVHEYFYGLNGTKANESQYKTMFNTKGSKTVYNGTGNFPESRVNPKEFKLFINASQNDKETSGYNASNEGKTQKTINDNKPFEFKKLKIMVYRFDIETYISSSTTSSDEAEWVNLSNIDGEAPLKICVPQKDSQGNYVQWLQEKVSIDNGYPSFRDWVGNQAKLFWERSKYTVNLDNLY